MRFVGLDRRGVARQPLRVVGKLLHLLGRHVHIFQSAILIETARVGAESVGVRRVHFVTQRGAHQVLFVRSEGVTQVGLCAQGEVFAHVASRIIHPTVGQIALSVLTGDGIHAVFTVAELRYVVRFLAKPRVVVARVALIGSGEGEIEELTEAIGEIERSHDAVRGVVFLRVVDLVENIVAIFILSVLVGAHVVGVALIVVVRSVVVEGGQRTGGAVSVAQRINFAGELLFLLHIGVESHIGLDHFGNARLHVERSRVAIVAMTELHPLFFVVAERSIVARGLTSARKRNGVVVVERIVGQQSEPIRVGRLGLTRLSHKGVIIDLSRDVAVISPLISHHGHVVGEGIVEVHQVLSEAHALLRVHQIDIAVGISRTGGVFELRIVGDAGRSRLTFLCCHDNHTVGRAGSVERSGGGILKHVDPLDVLWVESRDGVTDVVNVVGVVELFVGHIDRIRQGNSVEHPQRFAIADEGRRTANAHARRRTDFTGVLHEHHVGHAPFECLLETCHAGHEDLVHFERGDRAGFLACADRAVARDHRFAQAFGIVLEHEIVVHHAGFRSLHLALHTNVGHGHAQPCSAQPCGEIDHILTGLVRLNGPGLFALLHSHIGAHERIALFVEDHARELVGLGSRGLLSRCGERKTQRRTHQKTPD